MKAIAVTFAALLTAAALAGAARAELPTEEITFTYNLDRSMLVTEAGVQAVYADLEDEARRACTLPGTLGLRTVDHACVAELVTKVIAVSGSAALEARFAGSRLAMLMIDDAEQFASIGR